MSGKFKGKVAVVAGDAAGVGNAIVTALLAEEAKVAVGYMNESGIRELEEEFGDDLICVKTNVVDSAEQKKLVQTAVDTFGKLDVAFNVASGSKMGLIDTGSEENWDWTIELCLKGTYLGMKYQIQAMKQNGGGSIVNISSANAITPIWGDSAYNAAKKGVISLTESAMIENAEYNIRCNAVIPGQINMSTANDRKADNDCIVEDVKGIPMKRLGKPDEVANVALFLASDEASYVTGSTIIVDGGGITAGYRK